MTNDWISSPRSKRRVTRAALFPPPGVKSAAGCAANVHRAREPTRDERTDAENPDQDGDVQQQVLQT